MFPHDLDEECPPRQHPWTVGEKDDSFRYIDFKANPELIRTSLEDFTALAVYPAIERFYGMMEWLNGPESKFETNDCALRPPALDTRPPDVITASCNISVHGRPTLLFRDLDSNCQPARVHWIIEKLKENLPRVAGRNFPTAIGLCPWSHFFNEINKPGEVVYMRFWAWGESDDHAMQNLDGSFACLDRCFRGMSAAVK